DLILLRQVHSQVFATVDTLQRKLDLINTGTQQAKACRVAFPPRAKATEFPSSREVFYENVKACPRICVFTWPLS
ncbi:hypothetical protein, partial [Anabaena catenula]|uniref:hypothetical protein n=1 Tax=Anabaena catenula TaxID=1296320 RepID=UPI001A7EE872